MASGLIERKWPEDLLGCIVCKKELSDLRTLPCVHIVCLECLQYVGQGKAAGELMPCPACNEQFEIPPDGLVGMQKNYFIPKLLDIHKMMSSSTNIPCDFCSSKADLENSQGNPQGISEKIPHAVVFCVDCQQKICEPCRKIHTKVRTPHTHTLVNLKDKSAIQKLTQTYPRSYYCDRHPGVSVSIFCGLCRLPLCYICYKESHISHPRETVETASGSLRYWMLENLKQTGDNLKKFELHLSVWEGHKNNFTKRTNKVETMIESRTEDLKQKIDEHSKQLLQELSYIMERGLAAREEELDFWVRRISMLEHSEKYLKEVMLKGTAVELQQTIGVIDPRNFEWDENEGPSISHKTLERSDRFLYTRSNLEDFLSIEENNMVGEFVDFHPIGESRDTSRTGELSGITYLEDRIFTIHRRSKVVCVFEGHPPFDRLPSEDIDLKNDQDPRGICASTVCHSIFVIATEEQLISRIAFVGKASDKVHTISCWQLGFFPRGISVSVANDMFIMGFKQNTQKEKDGNQKVGSDTESDEDNRLSDEENRTSDGNDLSWSLQLHIGSQFSVFNPLIPIPEKCWKPIQAVQTSRRTFLVLYRRKKMDRICVCEISNSGPMLILHFRKLYFSDVGFPSDPCLEIDENDDLFVGLPGANSVTFVGSRRDGSRVEKQLMDEPERNKIGMCYVRSKRWLLVASTGPAGIGFFRVYSLRRPLTAQ